MDFEGLNNINESITNENYFMSKNDKYLNLDKFESGESNICLVVGLDGSNKNQIARKIANDNDALYVNLNLIKNYCLDNVTNSMNIKDNKIFKDYFKTHSNYKAPHGKKYGKAIIVDEYIPKVEEDFVKFMFPYMKKHSKDKFVVVGSQLYRYMSESQIKRYPTVISGTSTIKSMYSHKNDTNRKDNDIYLHTFKDMNGNEYTRPLPGEIESDFMINYRNDSLKFDKLKNQLESYYMDRLNDLPFFTSEDLESYTNYYTECNENKEWIDMYKLINIGAFSEDFYEINKNRIETLNELYKDYPNFDDYTKQRIINLGWNPEVAFSSKNRRIATENTRLRIKKILNESNVVKELEPLDESYVFSNNDLYINFDKFESGESNICLITGLSGSGKSTLGKQLASKYKAKYVELDLFEHCAQMTKKEDDASGNIFTEYFDKHKNIHNKFINNEIEFNSKEFNKLLCDFIDWVISRCKNDKENKYILEGVQIYSHGERNMVKPLPLIITGASSLKSIIRLYKREYENGATAKEIVSDFKNLPEVLKWYLGEEKELQKFKKEILKEDVILESKSNKKPVYLVFTWTETLFGKGIRAVTKGTYTHACISLDKTLNKLYSYNLVNGISKLGGMAIEDLRTYNPNGSVLVFVTYVTEEQHKKLKKVINDLVNNVNKTKYSILNVFGILLNRPIETNHNMVCSQFVDKMMKTIDLDLTNGKNSALVTPVDLYKSASDKIYKVYEGGIKDFKPNKIAKSEKNIKVNEAKLPIEFDSEGNLNINKIVDIQEEYNKSHKLLLNYEKSKNYKAMKEELFKLWALNIKLEKIIYKQKKANKSHYDLRARILNDFNKYIKIVSENEEDFNFSKEFDKSIYNNNSYSISKHTLKHGIQYIKSIFL